MSPKAILTDIEGTTTAISFVHDTLFPFSEERLGTYIEGHIDNPEVQGILKEVRELAGLCDEKIGAAIVQLKQWIAEDKKVTPLKALQGLIWEDGYRSGELKGHLYEDAVEYLRKWQQQEVTLYVYSSGSIKAQQLLFGHTEYGDLTPLFSGYFDTTTGPKKESASYEKIARDIQVDPAEIVFLSDIEAELKAAAQAGLAVVLLDREAAFTESDYPIARDFSEVDGIISR